MDVLTPDKLHSRGLILLEAVSGSQAYGLATADSDLDIRGVFMAPLEQLYDLSTYQPQVQDEGHNTVFFELGRFLELLGKNNPTVMELLASPKECVRYRDPLMGRIRPADFLSKLCRDTFGQYALAQVKKARGLNKKIANPVPVQRKTVLDCCFVTDGGQSRPLKAWLGDKGIDQRFCGLVCLDRMPHLYALYHDRAGQDVCESQLGYAGIVRDEESAGDVCLSSVPKGEPVQAYLTFNRDLFKKICKEYKAYWEWVEQRNQARYQSTVAHGGNYDAKNMMHTFRLLAMAEEIAGEGVIRVLRPDRDRLLAIRRGESDYETLVAEAESRIHRIAILFEHSALPERPDLERIHSLLVTLRQAWFDARTAPSGQAE